MDDVRELHELQRDALREVANIGAGHAATALSQLTNRTIMISVPEVNISRLEEVPEILGQADDVVAAVLMHMMGDLTGRTLVLFPDASAKVLCDILLRRKLGTTTCRSSPEPSTAKPSACRMRTASSRGGLAPITRSTRDIRSATRRCGRGSG